MGAVRGLLDLCNKAQMGRKRRGHAMLTRNKIETIPL